jgi:hypothetical protein
MVIAVVLFTLPAPARAADARAPRGDQGADRLAVESSSEAFRDWTTIGAAGIVDEADQGMEVFRDGWVTMREDMTGTLNLRYNVTAVEGLFGGEGAELGVRFRDNGAKAQVVVRLLRYSLETGDTTTLLTLDSDDFSARAEFQLRTVVDCGLRFNFFPYAYFMDIELRKTAATGRPVLGIIQLASVICR